METYFIYMMSNKNNTVLYIGMTNNLIRRAYEHRNELIDGFTKKYNCTKLVWFSQTQDVYEAIRLEKQMKKWRKKLKHDLINANNPGWKDLYDELVG